MRTGPREGGVVAPPPLGRVGRAVPSGDTAPESLQSNVYTQKPCEYISVLFTVTYTYKVVEAAGVEPASENPVPLESTCVSALVFLVPGVKGRLKPPEEPAPMTSRRYASVPRVVASPLI